jgi:transcriptional regulator with XRE-family HTH domain
VDQENRLGDFLRARRELVRPEDAGLRSDGRRRVPGLRREEVAQLAGVSTDYYVRLEQGRERHPSQQVIETLAEALRLDDAATVHLYRLAHPPVRRRRSARVERVRPELLQLLDGWTGNPAFVLGHAMDLLARNTLAAALFNGFGRADNLVRMIFLDPTAPSFYDCWPATARVAVGMLRAAAGDDPNSPRLIALVGELCVKNPEFRALWGRHEVRTKTRSAQRFHHPQVGVLELRSQAFSVNSSPGQQLVVYQAEPGSSSAQALALLGSLAAETAHHGRHSGTHPAQVAEGWA